MVYNKPWSWRSIESPHPATNRDVERLPWRVDAHADRFRRSLEDAIAQSRLDVSAPGSDVTQMMRNLRQATDVWKRGVTDETAVVRATAMLERASAIDAFMHRHAL